MGPETESQVSARAESEPRSPLSSHATPAPDPCSVHHHLKALCYDDWMLTTSEDSAILLSSLSQLTHI